MSQPDRPRYLAVGRLRKPHGLKEQRGYGWYYEESYDSIKKMSKEETRPQCSACFINSVSDSLESILDLAKTEGMLFKWGSGTGTNLSHLREEDAILSGGGRASGPLSFMKGFDAFAGVIKSGGKTRRAAKMVILNTDRPDVVDFIDCKSIEEKKAWALIDAGYDGGFNVVGGAYDSVNYQNANHSVRVTDDFMNAVLRDGEFSTKSVTDGKKVETFKARELMRKMADAAWICGDPGIQYDTTINDWHPCINTARINASNPCSEYMFLDDTACNLASVNLTKFMRDEGGAFFFDIEGYRHACRMFLIAQEILVDLSSYPTGPITKNSHDYRPLGLGYANLGSLLIPLRHPSPDPVLLPNRQIRAFVVRLSTSPIQHPLTIAVRPTSLELEMMQLL